MPKASKTKSRSKKIDTPLRQRKFAVPEKQVLEKIVTNGDEITVSMATLFMRDRSIILISTID